MNCDILIVGCGPTGAVLANLLGGLGCRVVVLEQAAEVHSIPRATHIDEETQRNFLATGLMPRLTPFTAPFGSLDVYDHRGRHVFTERLADRASPHGYSESCFFHQPAFEEILREGLARFPHVTILAPAVANRLHEHDGGVTVEADVGGERQTFRARWVVGCDGGRSFVRKSLGTEMESLAPRRPWIIVDTLLKDPTDAARLPPAFRYLLETERLTLYAHGFGLNRRWEFQLRPDESPPDDDTVRRWVARYVDLSRIEITRIAEYAHHSLVAREWRVGRVLLAGDAAHMMPPSAGQGMCSGVRDAVNLAWKLERVVRGADARLLDTYVAERRPHVCAILGGALFISRCLTGDTRLQRWWRLQHLRALGLVPWFRRRARRLATPRPPLAGGCLTALSPVCGHFLPQPFQETERLDERLDDRLGYRFALVARPDVLSPEEIAWAEARGIAVLTRGRDLPDESGVLGAWFGAHRLEFALVRPDKIVFAAGPRVRLAAARQEWDQWMNG